MWPQKSLNKTILFIYFLFWYQYCCRQPSGHFWKKLQHGNPLFESKSFIKTIENPSILPFFLPKSTTKAWREACELQDLPKNVSTIMKIIHDGYEYFIILFEEAAPGTEFINNAHCVLDQSVHAECTQREGPGLLYLKVDRRPTTAWKILWYTYLCTSRWPRPFLNLHHVYTTNEASIIVFSSYL